MLSLKERCLLGVFLLCAFTLAAQTQSSSPASTRDTGSTPATDPIRPPSAQENSRWLQPGEDPENRLISPFLKHLAGDQKEFWTKPLRFKTKDLKWILPGAGITAAFIASDSWWSRQVNPSHVHTSLNVSDYVTYAMIAAGGGGFLLGHVTHDDHLQEAGLLSGEAAINASGVTYLFKGVTQRQRPIEGNGNGDFFAGGASFWSEHSAIAWSIASVWAHEYPGWLSQLAAYGLASTVTVTRVTAKEHFPSDVVVGSALGWYFGRQVYRAHHDPEVGGSGWGGVFDSEPHEHTRNPDNMASPNVPVDSWIYPLFDRLAALGYVDSAHAGIRPWTRMECARLLEEAQERVANIDYGEGPAIYTALAKEFQEEIARIDGGPNLGATLESLYTRSTEISGPPLRDGFHFGQTIVNDYGRPYDNGFNNVSGVTARAVAGPLAFFVQGEYQHAPALPSEPGPALQATAAVDVNPVVVPNAVPQIDRFRLLNATATYQISNVEFSFGQQSLWLGPTAAGPLLFSNNAEPIPMLRIDSVSPYEIPLVSRLLGPVRTQFFLGRLSGQEWSFREGPGLPSQPWLHGSQVSFKPTANLEFGLGFTAQFGGTGNPFTWHNFLRSFFSHKAIPADNPAKRLSEFNFSYRIPHLRNWLTVYTDSMVIDEYSPIGSTRPQINPGIYFPRLPKIPKLDLRLEGVTTDLNIPAHFGPGAVYWDERYHSGYTNNGDLIGSWIGRRGRGEQAWATYYVSPRSDVQFSYRHNNVDPAFLQGGSYQDLSLRGNFLVHSQVSFATFVQYETWQFPLLAASRQSNVTGSVQVTFWPHWSK
jgi:membrane-associated phospholipid phosphatase